MIKELKDDIFFKDYKKYERCVIDYFILKCDCDISHKDIVLYSMKRIKEIYDFEISINEKLMKYELIDSKEFFQIPNNYNEDKKNITTKINKRPYWYLFLNPPYETNYTIDDFIKINDILFPKGKDDLEIYDWSVDWSNYFLEGLEWWGARCISIYDKSMDRYVVILASATD